MFDLFKNRPKDVKEIRNALLQFGVQLMDLFFCSPTLDRRPAALDDVRADPRFTRLVGRVGLPL